MTYRQCMLERPTKAGVEQTVALVPVLQAKVGNKLSHGWTVKEAWALANDADLRHKHNSLPKEKR